MLYGTVLHDGNRFNLWCDIPWTGVPLNAVCCRYMPFAGTQGVAHSADGFDWHKPQLKIMSGKEIAPAQAEYGSKVVSLPDTNNVVWAGGTSLTVSSDHSDLHDYKYVGGLECSPQDHTQ